MTVKDPLVSIVIPVKNGMPFIKDCVESVLKSTYKNFEIVVSDDGSTDGTKEYLASLDHPAVVVISPPRPLGIGAHWNFVSERAAGDYFKLLCADDTLTVSGIQNQVRALEDNSRAVMVCSRRTFIDEKGRRLFRSRKISNQPELLRGKAAIVQSFFAGTNIFGEPSAVMFRNEAVKQALPWVDSQPYLLDFEFYSRILLENNAYVIFSPTTDATFRVHGKSLSGKIQAKNRNSLLELAIKLEGRITFTKVEILRIRVASWYKTKMRSIVFFLASSRLK